MSILKVTRLGHPVLRQVAATVSLEDLQTPTRQKFIADMVETMKEYDGVGLAADQVFESLQIAVLEVADNPRYKSIRVRAHDRFGQPLDFVAHDFHARVIQHEFDHLNGTVYLDRMRDLTTLTFLQEFSRYWLRS